MAGKPRRYILTETAERDFREARGWSLSRWGRALTKQYFTDLHECAERIARNSGRFAPVEHVPNTAELSVYPIREHYLVYVPISEQRIAIVALIRQTRDVPAILNANGFVIRRQLRKILAKLALVNTAWDNFFCPANQLVMNGACLSPGRALPPTHSKVSFHKAAFTSHCTRSAQHRRGRALCNVPRRSEMMSMPGKILQIRSICPPTLGVGRVGMLGFWAQHCAVRSISLRV